MKTTSLLQTSVRCALGAALLAATALPASAASTLQGVKLRCEYKANPLAIDAARPRLSWELEAARPSLRNLKQGAYQVLVASSAAGLKADRADLWDSGKVPSAESVNIEYAGAPLRSAQDCFWKVRVWDQDDRESEWSRPGQWTMGLLQPEDWKARWIAYGGAAPMDDPREKQMQTLLKLSGGQWVWTAGAKAGNQPAGSAYFRKVIDLPADRKVVRAAFLIAADDGFTLYLNGHDSGNGSSWKTPVSLDVAGRLQPGRNALGIKVTNGGDTPSPAGLLGKLVVLFDGGEPLVVPIDSSWQGSRQPGERWKWADYDAAGWQSCSVIARHGDAPWGELKPSSAQIEPATCLRKVFTLDKPVQRAVLFASALGLYELHLNGKPAAGDVLSPGWTDYRKRVHYLGYDVTGQLKPGQNVLGAVLGDGWYAGYLAFTGKRHYYGDKTRLHRPPAGRLCRWHQPESSAPTGPGKAPTSPIREGDLLMGCVYDARLEMPGWDKPGFDDAQWPGATVDAGRQGQSGGASRPAHPPRSRNCPPESSPSPSPGVYVFDLGQNMVGWVRLKAKGAAGQKVIVRHAEMLNPDGTIYTTNLRAAKATDTFYLDGGPKRDYEPYFTFHGFQYVEVTGLDYKPDLDDLTGHRRPFRPAPRRLVRMLRAAGQQARRSTRSGARKATSSMCPPIARSATSAPAGPATPRCS